MATGKNQTKDFPNVVPQALVDASRAITALTIWDSAARTNIIGTLDITDSATVRLGQAVRLPANIITITVPTPTNGTAAAAVRAINGIIGTSLYVEAHYGTPGNDRLGNRLTELGMVNLLLAEWTVAP